MLCSRPMLVRDWKVLDLDLVVDVEVEGYYELVVTTFPGEPPRAHAFVSIS